jgi:hypothetical protein
MRTKNLIPAPIDNKNVLEDFTFNFHSDLYIGTTFDHVAQQVFFMQGCLCEITYRFGQNLFKFRIIEGDPFDVRRCNAHKDYLIRNMNGDSVVVKLNPTLGAYEFFFIAD